MRLDQLLVDKGLVPNRSRAQSLILAGLVYCGEQRLDKPGSQVAADLDCAVRETDPWVSRGAHKLIAGLDAFSIDPDGLLAVDIGASTGGFTDVLLARGARRVYAVDVGHGQLDWRLRQNPRVVVLEKCNARHLSTEQVPEPVDLVVCDASFISLQTILPASLALTPPGGICVALIKPQFEVGRGGVGKGGVVRDPAQHEMVCARTREWFERELGWRVLGIAPSPILGPKGNREFLIGAIRQQ